MKGPRRPAVPCMVGPDRHSATPRRSRRGLDKGTCPGRELPTSPQPGATWRIATRTRCFSSQGSAAQITHGNGLRKSYGERSFHFSTRSDRILASRAWESLLPGCLASPGIRHFVSVAAARRRCLRRGEDPLAHGSEGVRFLCRCRVRARTAGHSKKVSPFSAAAATCASASQSPRKTLNPFDPSLCWSRCCFGPGCRRRCWRW